MQNQNNFVLHLFSFIRKGPHRHVKKLKKHNFHQMGTLMDVVSQTDTTEQLPEITESGLFNWKSL